MCLMNNKLELIKVICDETNNTTESFARNEHNIDLYFVKNPQPASITVNFTIKKE